MSAQDGPLDEQVTACKFTLAKNDDSIENETIDSSNIVSLDAIVTPSLHGAETRNPLLTTGESVSSFAEELLPLSSRPSAILSPQPHTNSCEMCANYEVQLQQLQECERQLRQQLAAAQHLADRYHTELSGERLFRTELETKMCNLAKQCTQQVQESSNVSESLLQRMKDAEVEHEREMHAINEQLNVALSARNSVDTKCARLHSTYQQLLTGCGRTAESMRNDTIDMPQTIPELHILCLTLREQLIEETSAREHLHTTQQNEIAILREQLAAEQSDREQLESGLMGEVNELRTQLGVAQSRQQQARQAVVAQQSTKEQHKADVAGYQATVGDLEKTLVTLQHERDTALRVSTEYRTKLTTLQHELDTSESVQRDFVKLSQQLQMQLEKIRQSEQEVRWQFDEDIYSCQGCSTMFSSGTVKLHCRHCGRIFCDNCLANTVTAVNNRTARVCAPCHTLLCHDKRPYFSDESSQQQSTKKGKK